MSAPSPFTVDEALNRPGLVWTTGGSKPWFTQTQMTRDGLHAAQSGSITHSQTSWIEATATGSGSLKFWWRVSSEGNSDWLTCTTNGVQFDRISGTTGSWVQKTLPLPVGQTTVRWTYGKDGSLSEGYDCAWLDQVEWLANTMSPAFPPIPLSWLNTYYPGTTDFEQLAASIGKNTYPVWQSYVAGLNPTHSESRFQVTQIALNAHGDVELKWSPHLPDRTYQVSGKTNLTDTLWHSPTNNGTRFFKVTVKMQE